MKITINVNIDLELELDELCDSKEQEQLFLEADESSRRTFIHSHLPEFTIEENDLKITYDNNI